MIFLVTLSLVYCKITVIIHKTYTVCVNRPLISLERFLINSRLSISGESEVAPALWLWAAAGSRVPGNCGRQRRAAPAPRGDCQWHPLSPRF